MKIRTTDKQWNKRRFLRNIAAALAFGVFVPVQVSAEEVAAAAEPADETLVEAETNEFTSSYLELVDAFTTAERIPTARLDTPANVTVITASEIEANHYKSVSEALNNVNGIFGDVIGNMTSLVLVNGHRAGMYPPIKSVERIEIVRGGGSALYGTDAVSGVINIITKKGEFNETTLDFGIGSWHERTYELTNQGEIGDFGWFLAGTLSKARPYDFSGSSSNLQFQDAASDYDTKAFTIRLDQQLNDRDSISLDFMHASNHYNKYGFSYIAENGDTISISDVYYYLFNEVSLSYNFKEDTATPAFVRYFNNYYSQNDYYDGDGTTRLQGIDYQNGWDFGKHKVIAGLEWHRTNQKHWYWNYDDKKVTNSAYYLQDTISVNDKWTLVPGVRLDHHSTFGNETSPKLAANYRADDNTKVYASWGHVYDAPSLISLYTSKYTYIDRDDEGYPIYTRVERGNPYLDPQSGHAATIGLEHDFDDQANATISLFEAKINDVITNDDSDVYKNHDGSTAPLTRWINSDSKKMRGIEATFRKQLNENWGFDVGYALIHTSAEAAQEVALTSRRIPKNSFRVGVHYGNGPFKANLFCRMGTGSDNSALDSDSFTVLDFNTSYDVTDWANIYLKINNITDEDHSYYGNNFHSPGRSFFVGAQAKF